MLLDRRPPPPPIGWPLDLLPDAEGRMHFPTLGQSVRENLQVLLSTRPGEQLMHPEYGAGLTEFIGQPDTVATRRRIHDRVTRGVNRWETRILLDQVNVTAVPGRPGRLRIDLAYRLKRTGEAHTFGANLELLP